MIEKKNKRSHSLNLFIAQCGGSSDSDKQAQSCLQEWIDKNGIKKVWLKKNILAEWNACYLYDHWWESDAGAVYVCVRITTTKKFYPAPKWSAYVLFVLKRVYTGSSCVCVQLQTGLWNIPSFIFLFSMTLPSDQQYMTEGFYTKGIGVHILKKKHTQRGDNDNHPLISKSLRPCFPSPIWRYLCSHALVKYANHHETRFCSCLLIWCRMHARHHRALCKRSRALKQAAIHASKLP